MQRIRGVGQDASSCSYMFQKETHYWKEGKTLNFARNYGLDIMRAISFLKFFLQQVPSHSLVDSVVLRDMRHTLSTRLCARRNALRTSAVAY